MGKMGGAARESLTHSPFTLLILVVVTRNTTSSIWRVIKSKAVYINTSHQLDRPAIASWCLTLLLCIGTLAEALAGRAAWLFPARCSEMLLITLVTATLAGRSSFTLFGPRGCSAWSDRWDRDTALDVRSLPPLAGRCLKAGALPGRTRLAPSGRSERVSLEVMVRERP